MRIDLNKCSKAIMPKTAAASIKDWFLSIKRNIFILIYKLVVFIIKMTPIETLAAVFAVLVLLKLLIIIVSPRLRLAIAESILSKNAAVLTMMLLALTAIISYYVLSSLTIVEVAAVMMLMSGLMALFFIQYKKIMLQLLRESLSPDFLMKNWLSLLIWGLLAIWVLYAVLVK